MASSYSSFNQIMTISRIFQIQRSFVGPTDRKNNMGQETQWQKSFLKSTFIPRQTLSNFGPSP